MSLCLLMYSSVDFKVYLWVLSCFRRRSLFIRSCFTDYLMFVYQRCRCVTESILPISHSEWWLQVYNTNPQKNRSRPVLMSSPLLILTMLCCIVFSQNASGLFRYRYANFWFRILWWEGNMKRLFFFCFYCFLSRFCPVVSEPIISIC